jgi:hypothetical protein
MVAQSLWREEPRMKSELTGTQVADWMLKEVKGNGELYQENAVSKIEKKFGEQFTHLKENGNSSIGKDVLAAFRMLSKGSVVWEREHRRWRMRKPTDKPGRQQG